ncbi:hypothetical protein AB1Y20_001714 [Prymnesium parvum]|uniref:Uncharacterized protein n=1 Tax=Prymnesium parvum TaxID=97485 RepID=A0AB34KCG6_PRYPA
MAAPPTTAANAAVPAVPAAAPAPAAAAGGQGRRNSLEELVFKQYPGQQQVDLGVHIEVPGSWFADGAVGRLSAAERREKYMAVAVEYDAAHVFQGVRGRRGSNAKSEAIRFLCPDDAAEEANHRKLKLDQLFIELEPCLQRDALCCAEDAQQAPWLTLSSNVNGKGGSGWAIAPTLTLFVVAML